MKVKAQYQHLWDAARAVLRGLSAYIREEENSQINNLNSYRKKLERWDKK